MHSKQSVKSKILTALLNGQTFSVAQARNRFNGWNIAARIAELRDDGFSIYTNLKHRGDGTPVSVYRLGSPSSKVKAAARRRVMTGRGKR